MTQPDGHVDDMDDLRRWVDALVDELGVDGGAFDLDGLLDLARDVAHGVLRPAVPVTAFCMGYAVASGAAGGFDGVARQVRDQLAAWQAGPGPT